MSNQPNRRRRRQSAIAGSALLFLAGTDVAAQGVPAPWAPPIEQAMPGQGGSRVTIAGNIGNYYPGPAGRSGPAILLLGGSEGGLGTAVDGQARLLNRAGYAVLVLSWYRLPGQPQRLELVPLETFYAGLDWLAAQLGVDPTRVAMYGTSKGAEAALLVAARRPRQVRAVVAAVPSNVVWQGFDWAMNPVTTSSWSEHGDPVPFLPIINPGRMDIYGPSLATLSDHEDAIIPVERIGGPVLLICGEEDRLWPSCPMARAVQMRRDAAGGLDTRLLAYRDAGHAAAGPPVAADSPGASSMAFLGGSIDGNLAARADGWSRTLAFLAQALGQNERESAP